MKHISILIIFFYSCSSAANYSAVKTYTIQEIVETEKIIDFSQLNADVKFIPLETTTESMVGAFIKKVIVWEDYIYVFTVEKLLQFSRDGKFLRQISSIGNARNEYGSANDAFINKENGHIFIYDAYGKFIEYNSSGEYLKSYETSLTTLTQTFIIGRDNCLFESVRTVSGAEPYKLIVRTILGDTISKHNNNLKFNPSETKYSYGDSKSLFDFNNQIVYHQMSMDTVYNYNFETKMLDIRYVFDNRTPSTWQTYQEYNRIVVEKIYNNESGNDISLVYDIAEDKDFIYATIFTTIQGKQLYLIDKMSGDYYKANFRIENKLSKDIFFFPKWQEDDTLIDYVQLEDESNPTIVFITPK